MPKYLKYTLLALLWGGVAAYLLYAGGKVRRHRAEQPVTRIEVEVVDSTSQLRLVSEATVRGWLARSGIKTVGEKIGAVRLDALERLIARNGFVADARVTVSYSGVLHVAVWQRTPLMRLLIDGYNSYVTEEGYLFAVPRASSVYVPVITGTYRPPFPASYVGYAADYRREQMQQIDDKIAELEREKYPLYRRELKNDETTGIEIVKRAIEEPLRQITANAGVEGAVVVQKVKDGEGDFGYNARTDTYENFFAAGVIDPAKVTRVALENAASIAGMFLTTECVIADKKEENPAPAMPAPGMGGMGGMM